MEAIITNPVALQYNWTGSRGKHSFEQLKLSQTICGKWFSSFDYTVLQNFSELLLTVFFLLFTSQRGQDDDNIGIMWPEF